MLVPQEPIPEGRPTLRPLDETQPSSSGKVRRLGAWRVAGDLPASFRYAAQGLVYGFRSQRNFRIHVVTGVCVFGLGLWLQLPLPQLAVLVLTVAAIPVALPTVLSVTMAVGARILSKHQAIVSRSASIEELAGRDVLCSDKAGTLTPNKLTLVYTIIITIRRMKLVIMITVKKMKQQPRQKQRREPRLRQRLGPRLAQRLGPRLRQKRRLQKQRRQILR